MIVALILTFGVAAIFGNPANIMVYNEDGTTTTPPLVNYLNNGPSPSAIHLKYDSETKAEMMSRDDSYWVPRRLVLNRNGDDNSTIHVENGSSAEGEDRIVDGGFATPGELPMKARLDLNFSNGGFVCGSTILSGVWLLTAAHCVVSSGGTLQSVMARAGTISSSTGGQYIMASLAIPHENYIDFGNTPGGYDIALLKMSTPFIMDDFVQWAYISEKPNPGIFQILTAAGWGTTETGNLANSLKKASIFTFTCPSNNLGLPNFPTDNGESLVCTGRLDGHTCGGDSGGFVGRKHPNGLRWVVDGVVSFGPSDPNSPVCPDGTSGHTRVSFYQEWILATASSN